MITIQKLPFIVPTGVMRLAGNIKLANNQVNSINKVTKHNQYTIDNSVEREGDELLRYRLRPIMHCAVEQIDVVYLGCVSGVAPHKDPLNLKDHEEFTWLIPLVLTEDAFLNVGGAITKLIGGMIYYFNPQILHELTLPGKKGTGCAVAMATVKIPKTESPCVKY